MAILSQQKYTKLQEAPPDTLVNVLIIFSVIQAASKPNIGKV
jgi:hypothetical protein